MDWNKQLAHIQNRTGLTLPELLKLSEEVQQTDFQDERSIRRLLRKVGHMTDRDFTKSQEDEAVRVVLRNNQQVDFNELMRILKF
ncbi:stage VI sporulation protein F [Salsuginibacillus halophilus]|uniref:Stage VI sporulation protein F n=1 Tax=Salsuginibacillus halophilus TaxID=517424 RepID=A0A2P8HYI3_9BACI|nr:stage VI sporulation protein F [Salsuginibacillus halophilus]PSL51298.1 stage VI sporulation protein F [Salsuginibacillus halophilus]